MSTAPESPHRVADRPSLDAAGRPIGPAASTSLFADDDVRVWLMDVPAGGRFWSHFHDHDYVLFYLTDVVATLDEGNDAHAAVWNPRYEYTDRDPRWPDGVATPAHSLFAIPGSGFLSPGFVNIGDTAMVAPLVEVLRPRRADQGAMGFARSDAFAGRALPPGCTHLLENDRLRVFVTVLDPGATTTWRPCLDAAVVVIDGSSLERHERDGDGRETSTRVERVARTGHAEPGGVHRRLRNVGTTTYRELRVELK